jgi:hypothetical protein
MHFERAVLLNFEIGFSSPAMADDAAAINPARIIVPIGMRLHGVTHGSFAECKRCDKSGLDHDAENWKS